jgi:hypothetical protein
MNQPKRRISSTVNRVHIKDVVCDSNHRQHIRVITAKNLPIEDTILKNAGGTPRAAA